MPRVIHTGVSVRWMLGWDRAETKRQLKNIKRPDGSSYTIEEFRDACCDMIAAGTEVVPIGQICEGWSPKTGCPGHEESEESSEGKTNPNESGERSRDLATAQDSNSPSDQPATEG